jgi:hypothetical protein
VRKCDVLKLNSLPSHAVSGLLRSRCARSRSACSVVFDVDAQDTDLANLTLTMLPSTLKYFQVRDTGFHADLRTLLALLPPSLEQLDLTGNRIFGMVPKELDAFTDLRVLALTFNFLFDVLPDLSALSNLVSCRLGFNDESAICCGGGPVPAVCTSNFTCESPIACYLPPIVPTLREARDATSQMLIRDEIFLEQLLALLAVARTSVSSSTAATQTVPITDTATLAPTAATSTPSTTMSTTKTQTLPALPTSTLPREIHGHSVKSVVTDANGNVAGYLLDDGEFVGINDVGSDNSNVPDSKSLDARAIVALAVATVVCAIVGIVACVYMLFTNARSTHAALMASRKRAHVNNNNNNNNNDDDRHGASGDVDESPPGTRLALFTTTQHGSSDGGDDMRADASVAPTLAELDAATAAAAAAPAAAAAMAGVHTIAFSDSDDTIEMRSKKRARNVGVLDDGDADRRFVDARGTEDINDTSAVYDDDDDDDVRAFIDPRLLLLGDQLHLLPSLSDASSPVALSSEVSSPTSDRMLSSSPASEISDAPSRAITSPTSSSPLPPPAAPKAHRRKVDRRAPHRAYSNVVLDARHATDRKRVAAKCERAREGSLVDTHTHLSANVGQQHCDAIRAEQVTTRGVARKMKKTFFRQNDSAHWKKTFLYSCSV